MDSRSRVLLGTSRIDPRIATELTQAFLKAKIPKELAQIEVPSLVGPDTDLILDLRADNLQSFLKLRAELPSRYSIQDNLLLYDGRLCVQRNAPLCTRLIREAHDQKSTAHPGARKTYQLLAKQYY